jgi:hypothetical protein
MTDIYMKSGIIKKIEQKTGITDIVDLLGKQLTGSELNSLLLEVFDKQIELTDPALLLKKYCDNRFVQPAATDMIGLLSAELETLKFLKKHHFQPIELSPVSQLGSCSIVASVDQKKIISGVRNTEIMADATNALALHIAGLRKSGNNEGLLQFCTTHRHLRCQPFKEKRFTPHFKVGCLVSSGRDSGSYKFECENLYQHITTLSQLLAEVYKAKNIRFKLVKMGGYDDPENMFRTVSEYLKKKVEIPEIISNDVPEINNYYKGIKFKIVIEMNNADMEIADGGFVDWTQRLLGNKKERFLISGFGLGLLYMLSEQI